MALVSLYANTGSTLGTGLFGGNFLTTWDEAGPDNTFFDTADKLGLENLRYPGGSITEHYFDITDPDRETAPHFKGHGTVDLVPMSQFMAEAEEAGLPVTIVLPTQKFLSFTTDANGDRFPEYDVNALDEFIGDVVVGIYGNVDIQAFEIGNEYWGSGQMSAVEYGRIASHMSVVIQNALNEAGQPDIDIAVQMGNDYEKVSLKDRYFELGTTQEQLDQINADYNAQFGEEVLTARGQISWHKLANAMIMREFDTVAEQDAIDAIISHIYSKAPYEDWHRDFNLNVAEAWHNQYDDLTNYVTEWNVSSNSSFLDENRDYGLKQAHEYLNMLNIFAQRNVEIAQIWAVQHNAEARLSEVEGDARMTMQGEMYRLISESLKGAEILDLHPDDSKTAARMGDLQINGYARDGEVVVFISSLSETNQGVNFDFSELLASYEGVEMTSLKAQAGDYWGDSDATPVVTDAPDTVGVNGMTVTGELNPYEVLRLSFKNAALYTAQDEPNEGGGTNTPIDDGQNSIPQDDGTAETEDAPQDVPSILAESLGAAGLAMFLPLLILL